MRITAFAGTRMHTLTRFGAAAVLALAGNLAAPALAAAADPDGARPAATDAVQTVAVDGQSPGRTFDGVGGISSSSSRLIYDYPEPERGQILDYLFKPGYGAGLQILKVEIGGDANSTVTAEPSHERKRGAIDCDRGIEWWMMQQAKRRNPDIKLAGLLWSAPGWFDGGLWSDDQVTYLVDWLGCARQHGLTIDYLGGANEEYTPPPSPSFFVALHKALATTYPDVQIVATDEHVPPDYWHTVSDMKTNPDYRDAVDILGEHDVCVWHSLYQHCNVSEDALDTGKPLWNSEQSSQDVAAGAGPLARAMNRDYIDARVTGNINWAMAAGYYGTTDTGGTGILAAEWPWSGHYEVGPSLWVDAQTTQFAQPGWRYLDTASGYLTGGASYVSLRAPSGDDYTVVVETMDTTAPQSVRFVPSGGLSTDRLQLWSTDVNSTDPADWFVHDGTIQPGATLTLQPGRVYTLSTTDGQRHGGASPRAPEPGTVAVPYREDFEHVESTGMARYFQDVSGGFEAAPCEDRRGTCYQQAIDQQPLLWHDSGKTPATIAGDPMWWGDYRVAVDARSDQPGGVELLGRVEKSNANGVSGYHFQLATDGTWQLYTVDSLAKATVLASGTASAPTGSWHRLGLSFVGERVDASLDGKTVASVTDRSHRTGQIGLATSGWQVAQFDNVTVDRTAQWPTAVSSRTVTATASASQPGILYHHLYTPVQAIDNRMESRWQSPFDPAAPMPQSITIDLQHLTPVRALAYRPPVDQGTAAGIITGYAVSVSTDGKTFRQVASGTWDSTIATKVAAWSAPESVRYVRLTATATGGFGAAVAELDVLRTAPAG